MSPAAQIPLPLEPRAALSRADFIVTPHSEAAVAFIDSWPHWTVAAAALCGPSGSGKTHLVEAWKQRSGAQVVKAASLDGVDFAALDRARPIAIEDMDGATPTAARDTVLFGLFEGAMSSILLTGREPTNAWPTVLPDLAARFSSLVSFALWAPDDALLAALATKLFADRQLAVPQAAIARMLQTLERSPAAIRQFVEQADAKALAEGRPVNAALIRDLLAMVESQQS